MAIEFTTAPAQTTATSNAAIARPQTTASPEAIDELIRLEIERLTSENSSVWSSPDHNRREYVHSFFQYPAMMVPVVQKKIIDIIKTIKPETQNVIDPFMGSATSLVTCMESGLNCYGQDINPLSLLIAKTRTGPYYVDAIREKTDKLFISIDRSRSRVIESKFKGWRKWFKIGVAIELSQIVRAIRREPRLAIRRFYWINLAETIRLTSNDRTSTFKLHARPQEEIEKRNISAKDVFKAHLLDSIEDLELYRQLLLKADQLSNGAYKAQLCFSLQDSSKRIITPELKKDFFDLLITSPPYGDNKTTVPYGQHSYLPLQWIDLNDIDEKANEEFLRTTSEIDSRSLGGKLSELTEKEIQDLYAKSITFKLTFETLNRRDPDKSKKVIVFLRDLFAVVEKAFEVLKPNAYMVWTIGNRTVGGIEIPNNEILKEFIEYKGGKLVSQIEREILNKRMAKRNSNSALMNFEDILIFRKRG